MRPRCRAHTIMHLVQLEFHDAHGASVHWWPAFVSWELVSHETRSTHSPIKQSIFSLAWNSTRNNNLVQYYVHVIGRIAVNNNNYKPIHCWLSDIQRNHSLRMLPDVFSALVAGHKASASPTACVWLYHSTLKLPLHSYTLSLSLSVVTVILNRPEYIYTTD